MPGTLKINRLEFRVGPAPGQPALIVNPNNVLIIVGPNNSGKSLALREIENICTNVNKQRKVIQGLTIDLPNDVASINALLGVFKSTSPDNQANTEENYWVRQYSLSGQEHATRVEPRLIQQIIGRNPNDHQIKSSLVQFYTVRLDGRSRFSLAQPQPSGDLLETPRNHLWRLFKNDADREEVRRLVADAFGLHFVIDATGMVQFKIRLSSRAPANTEEEQSLNQASRSFHAAATDVLELSDGVQAFVGLVSGLLSLPHKIILIDEPEAFLHPPLARRLGNNISSLSTRRDASLITATHSADFLMGCLESVANSIVVRLTNEGGVSTARMLSDADLQAMIKDPLLRSTGTLRALFHRAAIVTESDSDRAFYDEINNRLLQTSRGVKDTLFINAQNKQTIARIVAPLREIGLPSVAIPDLDIIREARDLENLMTACKIPPPTKTTLEIERAWLLGRIQAITPHGGGDPLKKGGKSLLSGADLIRADQFFDSLNSYGIFPVPVGEMEYWLRALGSTGHGSNWLINIFSRIGQSPGDPNYLAPATGDVWEFIDNINNWVQNPSRLGV